VSCTLRVERLQSERTTTAASPSTTVDGSTTSRPAPGPDPRPPVADFNPLVPLAFDEQCRSGRSPDTRRAPGPSGERAGATAPYGGRVAWSWVRSAGVRTCPMRSTSRAIS